MISPPGWERPSPCRKLVTFLDPGEYIHALAQKETQSDHWQAAAASRHFREPLQLITRLPARPAYRGVPRLTW